eukprot:g2250.t1
MKTNLLLAGTLLILVASGPAGDLQQQIDAAVKGAAEGAVAGSESNVTILLDHNDVAGQVGKLSSIVLLAEVDTVAECEKLCLNFTDSSGNPCQSFTYHTAQFKGHFARKCYGRTDLKWQPKPQQYVDCGKVNGLPPPKPTPPPAPSPGPAPTPPKPPKPVPPSINTGDPSVIPLSFSCAWRALAYEFASSMRSDAHSLSMVFDALMLGSLCKKTRDEFHAGRKQAPSDWFPPHLPSGEQPIYVDADKGNDSNAGTLDSPVKTIGFALSLTRKQKAGSQKTIELRAGVYYLSETIVLTPADDGLTIQNHDGEEAWLSGAQVIGTAESLKWAKACSPQLNKTLNIWTAELPSCTALNSARNKRVQQLRVDGVRVPKARYPNIGAVDTAYIYDGNPSSGWEHFRPGPEWLLPHQYPNSTQIHVNQSELERAYPNSTMNPVGVGRNDGYAMASGGSCSIFDPPVSYSCLTLPHEGNKLPPIPGRKSNTDYWLASGFSLEGDQLPPSFAQASPSDWAEQAMVHTWRKAHWCTWQFDVADYAYDSAQKKHTIKFGRGGFQGARGSDGSELFIEGTRLGVKLPFMLTGMRVYIGMLPLLDAPREWHVAHNSSSSTCHLYFYPNASGTAGNEPPDGKLYEAPILTTLIQLQGTQQQPVKNITLRGIGMKDTAPTFMYNHSVPSGGDWVSDSCTTPTGDTQLISTRPPQALERFGAIMAEGSEGFAIDRCRFSRLDGNAVMLSGYHRHALVNASDFFYLGGTAVAAWGKTDEMADGGRRGFDATQGDFPIFTVVQNNLFTELGVWQKQSSAFFQAKAARSTVRANIVQNGPRCAVNRAGINMNDGFAGGDLIEANLIFNQCRESGDHGPFSVWSESANKNLKSLAGLENVREMGSGNNRKGLALEVMGNSKLALGPKELAHLTKLAGGVKISGNKCVSQQVDAQVKMMLAAQGAGLDFLSQGGSSKCAADSSTKKEHDGSVAAGAVTVGKGLGRVCGGQSGSVAW